MERVPLGSKNVVVGLHVTSFSKADLSFHYYSLPFMHVKHLILSVFFKGPEDVAALAKTLSKVQNRSED